MIKLEEIGTFLRLLREERGLSQDEAAEIIGVCGKTVHNIELGKKEAALDTIFRLCDLYGVSPVEIGYFYERFGEMDYAIGIHHIPERYRDAEEHQSALQSDLQPV